MWGGHMIGGGHMSPEPYGSTESPRSQHPTHTMLTPANPQTRNERPFPPTHWPETSTPFGSMPKWSQAPHKPCALGLANSLPPHTDLRRAPPAAAAH